MRASLPTFIVALLVFAASPIAILAQPPASGIQRSPKIRSAEQWVRQLERELDHLEEDLHYERGRYPAGLSDRIDQASRAAAHFRQVLRRNESRQHLMRDFEEMDHLVHQLVKQLEDSSDPWLRRQASRVRYPDEQLHFVLQRMTGDRQAANHELLVRHAHVLSIEARNLQDLIDRVAHPQDPMRGTAADFADAAEHFHHVVERGSDDRHLINDFREVDEQWQAVVKQLNRSSYGLYLRRNAQNVNRVHNQVHQLLTTGHAMTHPVPPQAVEPPPSSSPSPPVVPPRTRPSIEFEIPGIGRFSIPR